MTNHRAGELTLEQRSLAKLNSAKKIALAKFAIEWAGKDYFEEEKISFVKKFIKKNRCFSYNYYFDDEVNHFEAKVLTEEEYQSLSCGLGHNLHFNDYIDNFYIIVEKNAEYAEYKNRKFWRMIHSMK